MIGWAAVVFSLQKWLGETPEQARKAGTPAYLSVGMSLMAVLVVSSASVFTCNEVSWLATDLLTTFLASCTKQRDKYWSSSGCPPKLKTVTQRKHERTPTELNYMICTAFMGDLLYPSLHTWDGPFSFRYYFIKGLGSCLEQGHINHRMMMDQETQWVIRGWLISRCQVER